MADNYLTFSTDVPMNEEELKWVSFEYSRMANEAEYGPGFNIEQDTTSTVFYSEDSGDTEMLAVFLRAFLIRWRPRDAVGVEFALTCSKARPGEFGGGAFVVTATTEHWISTAEWISEKLKEIG